MFHELKNYNIPIANKHCAQNNSFLLKLLAGMNLNNLYKNYAYCLVSYNGKGFQHRQGQNN
ncbi:hypothetical protein COX58_00320 [archaeon CG_4_10_14_0_2_um_filter_Archaea_38_6]|nr:MAG: hypothetical protein COX58_00320 [archaeon CG_4_10_14_0_2_um_filter_Archaea_38_6]